MPKQIQWCAFPPAAAFELSAVHRRHSREHHYYQLQSHCHQRCEIYVNLSGEVAFAVEGRVYPISAGDVVVTRPLEYHNCVYRGDAIHEYYWILFSCKGNESLLPSFFSRPMGEGNRIRLPQEQRQAMLAHCRALAEETLTPAAQASHFWGLMALLETGSTGNGETQSRPAPLEQALAYLTDHLSGPVSVGELSRTAHVSVNTLERLFRQHTGMTPTAYVQNRRLQEALRLLEQGHNITETALAAGFCDSSYFILQFKRKYGMTPHRYCRSLQKEP